MNAMLTKDDIKHLSTLARIAVSEEEEESLAKDLGAVLGYVSEVSAVATKKDAVPSAGDLRNVMREDDDAYSGGEFTDMILKNAPDTEDGYFKVKQIF